MPPKKKNEASLLAQASRRKTAPPVLSDLTEPSLVENAAVVAQPSRGVKGQTGFAIQPAKVEKQLKKESSESEPGGRALESILTSLLDRVSTKPSNRSRNEQVRLLMGLKYGKEPLLSLDTLSWLHETAALVSELGFDATYAFLNDMVVRNVRPNDWVVGSPLFAAEQRAFRYRIRNLTLDIEVKEGIYTCGKCGGKNTISMPMQLRGGDEGMTDVVTCLACRHKFHQN